uniref:NADH-ubiquinone oxidoreductase chain 3 n=1 Tax=Taeniogonalos taihorina TaxID=1515605 RepID=A0A0K0KBI6_9HYME|nr:NADH dehydrogenase subunit 3 [Taeniogonalos taihorina]AIE11789.1 NADH dehydrogenase subunit 3 [Taeniogonalos taihorina]
MFNMIFILFIILFICLFLILMNLFLMKKMNVNREKSSPYECGFDPYTFGHVPFSIQFYLISIIFLIFDIEIALLLSLIPSIYSINLFYLMTYGLMFIIILIFGVMIEWNQGSLNWII